MFELQLSPSRCEVVFRLQVDDEHQLLPIVAGDDVEPHDFATDEIHHLPLPTQNISCWQFFFCGQFVARDHSLLFETSSPSHQWRVLSLFSLVSTLVAKMSIVSPLTHVWN